MLRLINTDRSYTNESINEVVERSRQYVNLTNMGILLTKIPKKIKNIKISVVIPVYNAHKYIKRAVRSIQNQKFEDFEIILVDDVSKDNSVKIMEELANEDSRIKIIKNNKNSGTLYSRCIGVLNAKGKFIVPLDNDDIFLIDDLFDVLYNDLVKNNLEIINYRAIWAWNWVDFFTKIKLSILRTHKYNYIMYQPKLGNYGYSRCFLWTQIIKTELYKKAINLYGNRIYNYVNSYEDCIMSNIIFQTAKSAKLLLKIGILHIYRGSSSGSAENIFNMAKFKIYYIESRYDFRKYALVSKDDLLMELINLLKEKKRVKIILKDEKIKLFLISFIKRIYKDNNVSDNIKEMIVNNSLNINLFNSAKEITE